MNCEFPLMEEENKAYIVSSRDINLDALLCNRPGSVGVLFEPMQTITTLRQWWQPIEDEL